MYRKPSFNASPSVLRDPLDGVRRVGYTGSPAHITKFNPNNLKARKLAELLPTMQTISRRPRPDFDPDDSRKISVTHVPIPSAPPSRGFTRGSDVDQENFNDFSNRILTATGNHLDLDPELKAAFRDLSGGSANLFSINSASVRAASRQSTRLAKASAEVTTSGLPSSAIDSYEIGTTRRPSGALDPYQEKVFETTFGVGTSGVNMERYRDRNRNRIWDGAANVTQATRKKLSRAQKEKLKEVVTNISDSRRGWNRDHDIMLEQGKQLLIESNKFKAPKFGKIKPEPTLSDAMKVQQVMDYFPYTNQEYIEEQRERLKGKMSIYERLEAKRQEVMKRRFADEGADLDNLEDPDQGWQRAGETRGLNLEDKDSSDNDFDVDDDDRPDDPNPNPSNNQIQVLSVPIAEPSVNVDKESSVVNVNANAVDAPLVPFAGLKLSSLVGNRAAAMQGFQGKSLDPKDRMNSLQQFIVDGLEVTELSAFLPVGQGHRVPRRTMNGKPLHNVGDPKLKPKPVNPVNPNRFQSATARPSPTQQQTTYPVRDTFLDFGRTHGSTPHSILNDDTSKALKQTQLEMLLDKRSTFNTISGARMRRGKNGEKFFIPAGWSMDDFDDMTLDLDDMNMNPSPKEKTKLDIFRETKLQRIRQIKSRETQARTYNRLLQPSTWN